MTHSGLVLLDDKSLLELYDELIDKVLPPFEQIISIKSNSYIVRDDVNKYFDGIKELIEKSEIGSEKEIPEDWDTKDFKKGIDFKRVQSDLREAERIITKMKARLDKLAEKVP